MKGRARQAFVHLILAMAAVSGAQANNQTVADPDTLTEVQRQAFATIDARSCSERFVMAANPTA
ncbi:hypothetical protein [Qipengyuania aquimaris]|uniref:hypothetical protein n=1 Tax=Qipengyuania aquimaris TaxID=255984 RepID=UPI001CD6E1DE|nr:hypothetical protein [Qipengyuania aquimaris]MCA0902534.1 hypothetical protein [Qipengyuania aquimaris]